MSLQEQVRADMIAAMKAKDALRLSVLRGLVTSFTNELTATKRTPQDTLLDDEVLKLIQRGVKQRKDAAEQFRAGGRDELAENEDEEAKVLQEYLPEQMSEEEVERVVKAKMEELGVSDKTGMGQLMGAAMSELKGRADGAVVKDVVSRLLS